MPFGLIPGLMPEAISWVIPLVGARANLYHLPAGFSLCFDGLGEEFE